jgi:hypothetical protein
MKSLSIALLLAVLLVACGGSDPLAGVENCSDLAAAVNETDLDLASDEAEAFILAVEELGTELGQDAIANGAELEAVICADSVLSASGPGIRATFEEIEEGLS